MLYQVKGRATAANIGRDLLSISNTDGFRALWKGNASAFMRTFIHAGIVFMTYDIYQDIIQRHLNISSNLKKCISGGLAGVSSAVILYPLDLWNTKMAVSGKDIKIYSQIITKNIYIGFLPTLIGIFPYAAISFVTFERLKSEFQLRRCEARLPPWLTMVCGSIAGLVSQTVTYPMDTVRKSIQSSPPGPHSGIRATFSSIYQQRGLIGFFHGVTINWIKGPLSVGISFMLHEYFQELFHF
eukprot:GHVL01019446.1.p1 GENE.GHVL01019446.1~~GHVL01019446.1.p1  ORF type:complete len:241 (-),score=36.42 GHVL01019446.1:194-916(-)